MSARCEADGCQVRARFGYPELPQRVRCQAHQLEGMVGATVAVHRVLLNGSLVLRLHPIHASQLVVGC